MKFYLKIDLKCGNTVFLKDLTHKEADEIKNIYLTRAGAVSAERIMHEVWA